MEKEGGGGKLSVFLTQFRVEIDPSMDEVGHLFETRFVATAGPLTSLWCQTEVTTQRVITTQSGSGPGLPADSFCIWC